MSARIDTAYLKAKLQTALDEVQKVEAAQIIESAKPQIPLSDTEYEIKFAYRAGKRGAANLPIAFTGKSWRAYDVRRAENPEIEMILVTTTGEKVWVRRADCGAGCRCALEWRPM